MNSSVYPPNGSIAQIVEGWYPPLMVGFEPLGEVGDLFGGQRTKAVERPTGGTQ